MTPSVEVQAYVSASPSGSFTPWPANVNSVAACRPIPEGDTARLVITGARFVPVGAVTDGALVVEFPPQADTASTSAVTPSAGAISLQVGEYV